MGPIESVVAKRSGLVCFASSLDVLVGPTESVVAQGARVDCCGSLLNVHSFSFRRPDLVRFVSV